MTLGIAHFEHDQVVLDCIREITPPFAPDAVVEDFAATLKSYGLHSVTGDRYGGLWPQERFQKHGIEYIVSDLTRSDLYRELLPLLNSRSVTLLDHQRLVTQLCSLERRTARGGKDSIDHGPHAHDDVINSAAGRAGFGRQACGTGSIWFGRHGVHRHDRRRSSGRSRPRI